VPPKIKGWVFYPGVYLPENTPGSSHSPAVPDVLAKAAADKGEYRCLQGWRWHWLHILSCACPSRPLTSGHSTHQMRVGQPMQPLLLCASACAAPAHQPNSNQRQHTVVSGSYRRQWGSMHNSSVAFHLPMCFSAPSTPSLAPIPSCLALPTPFLHCSPLARPAGADAFDTWGKVYSELPPTSMWRRGCFHPAQGVYVREAAAMAEHLPPPPASPAAGGPWAEGGDHVWGQGLPGVQGRQL
jgi:hypothetical protein